MRYSVIIPVYNCIAYLRGCVESLPLDREDLEVLLIDDGASDGSGVLCDQLASEYPQIRVIHQENGGVSAARNRGIREAMGEYLLFVDSDDTVDTEKLNHLLDVFPETGADLAIFGIFFDYYHHGKRYRSDLLAYPQGGLLSKEHWAEHFAQLFEANGLSSVWAKILKRSLILEYDLSFAQDMFLYEDLEFILRYLVCCGTIYNEPQGIYRYRQSEDEGNAGRRLKRIERISDLMIPLETAMDHLCETVSEEQRQKILLQLYLVLARGKIGVSDLAGIRRVCEDYILWSRGKQLPTVDEKFQSRLAAGKAAALFLQNKKTALRHKIAVAVKSCVKKIRK